MSEVYLVEALLDAAGLSEFSEFYVQIYEHEPKPIVYAIANQIIVGQQNHQDQEKVIDDKLSVQPPLPAPIIPIAVAAEVKTI
ncbi:MAG: hypothetical protein EZS28_040210 [Streblomastix strix]|uniref:Uncharacterized protein n=1 Tax=Streblomastix strix TaxID=222440 RepID=A0A5J4U1K6_9EUKA|nr:MAG: hypothetical protein EZS28_040210 [Streblomastix strix]